MPSTLRVRSLVWFATGAVLSLLATVIVLQTWRADAAPGDTETTFVPVAPCRLFDYRPAAGVSARNTPIGPGETATQQITGAVGACNIPPDATGVSLNVTITQPTAASNLRIFPAGLPLPNASNLNWTAGQGDTPNKVDVQLSPTGAIDIYNDFGSVFVLADATGYYTHTGLADLQQQITALQNQTTGGPNPNAGLQGQITALQGLVGTLQSKVTTLEKSRAIAVHAEGYQSAAIGAGSPGASVVVRSVTITAPVAGSVTVNSSHWAYDTGAAILGCAITTATSTSQYDTAIQRWYHTATEGVNGPMAATRGFSIAAGQTVTYNLVCLVLSGTAGTIENASLTAIFTPNP